MKLSHSKLSTILSCPMSYYLNYIESITPITEKSAFAIGSAVHWGIEHNTEDLTEYFGSAESEYTRDQLLSEAMVHGYLKHKDGIFDQILRYNGEKLTLVEESHELYVTGNVPTTFYANNHDFVGIIDLLLLTDKGFVIIDYKTSSNEPDWNNYIEQLYKYIMLVQTEFPDIPILKIGIINLRKTNIRQKKGENYLQFLNRMKLEYDINDDNYILYHEYDVSTLNPEAIQDYIKNLSVMCDMAQTIDERKLWYINYTAANGIYGKSQYWDIFYKTPDCYLLYKIADQIIEDGEVKDSRQCRPIDMLVIEHNNVMNHYSKYKAERGLCQESDFEAYIKSKYICDDELLENYEKLFEKNI